MFVVLCAVRARGHGRAHPRQDRRLEEEGDVDGRRAAARVSGAGPQARHHRQRGGNYSLDLSPLCGPRLGPAFEGRARSPKDRQQIVDERFGSPRRRQAVLTRRALPDFAEPYLSRIRIAGNKAASSRSLTSAAGDCGYPCQKPEASSARRETTLQREIAVKNVSLGIFD